MESRKRSPWLIRGIGVLLAVAGVGLWGLSIMQGLARASAEAHPIFDALGTAEEESAQDAAALIQLSHSSRAVRAAFLRYALQSEPAADKVRIQSSPEPFEQAASAIVANANNLAGLEPALRRTGMKLRPPKAEELAAILKAKIAREEDPKALRVLGQALADLPVVSADSDLRRVLAVSQAPCEVSRSAVQPFNPLCSEASWNELAASAAHAKAKPTADDLEPVFTQLAADDDDAAGDKSTDDAALDFHQLSDAVNGFRPVAQEIRPPMGARWSAIALLVLAAVVLLYSARFGVRHRASAITG